MASNITGPTEIGGYLDLAWRRKRLVLLGLAAGLFVGGVAGWALPRTYQSNAQIAVVKKRPDAVAGAETRPSEEYMSPPQDLLKSPLIIDRAIQSKRLDGLPLFVEDDRSATEQLRDALTVTPGRSLVGPTTVYKLSFRGRDPDACRAVLAALLETYKEFMDKKHQTVSEDTIELIVRNKVNLEKEILERESAYRAFRESAPLLGKGKDGAELRQERLNSIQTRRSAVLMQRIEVEAQLTSLEAAIKDGRSQDALLALVADFNRRSDAAEPGRERQVNIQEQLFTLLLEERKQVELHGVNNQEVQELRNRIELARKMLVLPSTAWKNDPAPNGSDVDPVKLHVQLLKQKLSHLKISEEILVGVFQTEQEEARRLAVFEIQNEAFRTRITMNQQLYEALVKRLNEVNLIRNVGGYQIEMLETPALGRRVAPSAVLCVLIGGTAGVMLGFGLAFGAEMRAGRNAV